MFRPGSELCVASTAQAECRLMGKQSVELLAGLMGQHIVSHRVIQGPCLNVLAPRGHAEVFWAA